MINEVHTYLISVPDFDKNVTDLSSKLSSSLSPTNRKDHGRRGSEDQIRKGSEDLGNPKSKT
jgi:hypothetical protein